MEPAVGAWCTGTSVCFRLRDHERRLTSVRMSSGVLPPADFTYVPEQHVWELRRPCPAVWRIEYRYELRYADGSGETVPDPDNPRRAGDASELRCTGYREPEWLDEPPAAGAGREVSLPMPPVRGEMVARIWSPAAVTDRVLVAHDGPEYQRLAALQQYAAAMAGAGRLPPFHLVLLPPGGRLGGDSGR